MLTSYDLIASALSNDGDHYKMSRYQFQHQYLWDPILLSDWQQHHFPGIFIEIYKIQLESFLFRSKKASLLFTNTKSKDTGDHASLLCEILDISNQISCLSFSMPFCHLRILFSLGLPRFLPCVL